MPATSPTLSPTLSAITAGYAGVVLGNPKLDLAGQIRRDIGGLVNMPPPALAKSATS
jgi:hypothetical protein